MAAGYLGYSESDWARSMHTILAKHMRDTTPAMLRNYQMLAVLQSAGNVLYNQGGRGFTWPVQYRLHQVTGNTGESPRNFARRNLWTTAHLPYRGYEATDAIYKKELLEAQGEEAIVRVFDGFTERIGQSIKQTLGRQVYVNGNAEGNEQYWHGFDSMFATNGTLKFDDGTQRSASTDDYVAYPSATYAGLSTELGNYGGENEAGQVWPHGVADPEFDFWTPIIALTDSKKFEDLSECMSFAITHSQRNTSQDGQITNVWLARDLFLQFKNEQREKERIEISGEHSLRAMGFKNIISFDGVEVSWEAGVPTGCGYGMNFNGVDLRCMNDELLETEGPEYDIDMQAYKAVVGTLSNLRFSSPRDCFKLIPSTAA